MLEWIRYIGQFIASMFHGLLDLIGMFADCIATITAAAAFAPGFLQPILMLTLSVAIIMWVVNLL